MERADDARRHATLRQALEVLGVKFEGDRGAAFFRSTLVQTLFYGVFSAWVRGGVGRHHAFRRFRLARCRLAPGAPMLRALFQQLSDPGKLQPLGLVEVLDWTANCAEPCGWAFFAKFGDRRGVVPYFYEGIVQAFDPELRKQLGDVVQSCRGGALRWSPSVDKALKDEADIPDGLAGENVYVLDPCCGTGAYLAEVLRASPPPCRKKDWVRPLAQRVKQAATQRVFGFEMMPAPFVVAHLQVA